MTIASEIQIIQTNIANAYDALEAKGATMPATENTDNLVTTIDTISGGGGDVVTATNNTGNQILAGDKVWIEKNDSSYSLENFDSSPAYGNFVKKGTCSVDTNYIASSFNSNSGIVGLFAFPFSTAENWEIVTKINSPSVSSAEQKIFFASNVSVSGGLPILQNSGATLGVYNNKVIFQGVYSSSSNTPDVDLYTNQITINSWEYIKVEYTGSEYNIYQSSDNVTWVKGGSYTPTASSKLYQPSNNFILGTSMSSSGYVYTGSIDLKETYIVINGKKYWSAVENVKNVTQDSLTGYAQENIASGSTGDVLTLLPPEPVSKKKRLVSVADNLDTNKLVLYTDDGINWNTSTMPNSRNWGHPFYGDGKFIVPCYGSNIFAYSTDGITWTEGTFPQDTNNDYRYQQGAYGNGIYLIGFRSLNGGPNRLYKSTDGINWTIVKPFEGLGIMSLTNLIFDGTKFIAAFNNSTSIRYSLDGETWTAGGTIPNYASDYNDATFIYDSIHQLYIIAGSNIPSGADHTTEQYIYVSSDLTTWSRLNLGNTYTNIAPTTSCIIDNKIKIFSGSPALSGNYSQCAGYIEISSDGSSATFVGSSVPRLNYQGGANIINDRAVVIGYGSNQYIYSTDGTTWNTGTLPASSGWWGSCVGEVD